jgi:hypothetical protein
VLQAAQGGGLAISSAWSRRNGQINWELSLANQGQAPLGGFAIQFNVNSMGFTAPPGSLASVPMLSPGQTFDAVAVIPANGQKSPGPYSDVLQIAIKHSGGIFYFSEQVPFETLLAEAGQLEGSVYISKWSALPEHLEHMAELQNLQTNPEHIKGKLALARIFFVAQRKVENQDVLYFSAVSESGAVILIEITYSVGQPLQLCIRTEDTSIPKQVEMAVEKLLR